MAKLELTINNQSQNKLKSSLMNLSTIRQIQSLFIYKDTNHSTKIHQNLNYILFRLLQKHSHTAYIIDHRYV